jgi:hypothetical protein
LVVALSTGGAYAAGLIGTNQIANYAVTAPKIATNAVVGSKIAGGAVTNGSIANYAVSSGKLAPALRAVIVPPGGVIPHHVTVGGDFYEHGSTGATTGSLTTAVDLINLPARAPVSLVSSQVGFGPNSYGATVDSHCTGTPANPTAPAGWVCVYLSYVYGLTHPWAHPLQGVTQERDAFYIVFNEPTVSTPYDYYGSWAYTAP